MAPLTELWRSSVELTKRKKRKRYKGELCPACKEPTLEVRYYAEAVVHDCHSCGYLMAWTRS